MGFSGRAEDTERILKMSSDTGCDIAGDDKEGRSMKKRNWVCLILIAVCLAVFYGYQVLDRISTDTKPPQIRMEEQALQVSVTEAKTNLLQGVTAKDEEDGNVTGSLVVESVRLLDHTGRANVTYAAFDKSGNVAKAEREFRYTDYQRPRFSLSEPLVFSQNKNIDLADYVRIQDFLDGDISHRLRAAVLSEQSLNKAVATLNDANAKLLGCVLNNVYSTFLSSGQGYHYDGYGRDGHYGRYDSKASCK